jgi:hypothetical protein
MIRLISTLRPLFLQPVQAYRFSLLTDYFTKKQLKKQENEFKKEMEYLANKPVFTLMDYKQRIEDELQKTKGRKYEGMQSFEPSSTRKHRIPRNNWRWRGKSWLGCLRRSSTWNKQSSSQKNQN